MAEKGSDKEASDEKLMALDDPDLYDSYKEVKEKTLELYSKDVVALLELALVGTSFADLFDSVNATGKITKQKHLASLLYLSSCELAKIRGRIIFLTTYGLYREAISNIRFILEMVFQAYYIDRNHKNSSIATKLEILKEIGDKREYRAANLIEKLGIGDNKELQGEYKSLSKQIHASYDSFYEIFPNFLFKDQQEMLLSHVKQCEILDINLSLRKLFDIFFFLFFLYFSECVPDLNANNDVKTAISRYNFKLLKKLLNKDQKKAK